MQRLLRWLRDSFVSGLLAILPMGLTSYVLWLFYRLLRTLLGPETPFAQFLLRSIGHYIPGIEIILTLFLVVLIGAITRNWLGKQMLAHFERLVLALPGVRKLYWATRQLSRAVLGKNMAAREGSRLVLIEFPEHGYYVMGILTNEELGTFRGALEGDYASVYMPTAPNPLSGWVFFVPKDRVTTVDMTVDEGLALVLSGGVVVPSDTLYHHSSTAPDGGDNADKT